MQLDPHSDFHTHSRYSDGGGTIPEMVEAAIAANLSGIVITDHSPLPFPTRYALQATELENYRAEILQARATHGERIAVGMGMEFEYIPEHAAFLEDLLDHHWDHRILSIHHLGGNGALHLVNGGAGEFVPLLDSFANDGKALCSRYYRTMQEGVESGWFDSVGHLDIIKKHNPRFAYFDENESWYRDLVLATLDLVKAREMSVEINTGGFNHPPAEQYPSGWVIEAAAEMDIPLVLSSDAHSPAAVGRRFDTFRPPSSTAP